MRPLFALLAMLALAGCISGTENYTPQPLQFSDAPVRLNVASINVTSSYQSPQRAPNVEHTFPTPPAQAVHQWAKQRLAAAGQRGILEVLIEQASVREETLPKKTGIEGFFTDEQDVRYDASIKVSMRIYDGISALSTAHADVYVTRSRTLNERASIAEREKLFDSMIREMMAQFEIEANTQMNRYFTAYLLR